MRFSAKQFAAAGVHANARNWHYAGFTPVQAVEWQDAGYASMEAHSWYYAGFTPVQAVEWQAAGYASSDEAYRWKYSMRMAMHHAETVAMALGNEPYPSYVWPSAAVAASYRDAGVEVGLAARWFLAGVEPAEAAVSEHPAHWRFSTGG